jgi:hypothetical protein
LQITEREFEELFPGQVAWVGIVHDTTALDPLVKEYQMVTRQLEDLLDEYIGRKKQLKKIKRKKVTQMLLFADENLQSSQKG